MSSLSQQVQDLENELYEYKSNAGMEKNIINMNMYEYTSVYEDGYVLAKNKIEAQNLIGEEDADISIVFTNEQLLKLLNNQIIVTRQMCY